MKPLKTFILFLLIISVSNVAALHQWEFQFRVVNNIGQFQESVISIYSYDIESKNYILKGSGLSSTTEIWGAYNAIVNVSGVSGDHHGAIMTIPFYSIYVVRINNSFLRIEFIGYVDETFDYNTDTGSFTNGGNWLVTTSGAWNDSFSILLKNNFAGGSMYLNYFLFTNIPLNGITEYREASTFPHEITAIDNQQPGSYKMLWDKWSDDDGNLGRTLSSAQNFTSTANFKKEYKVTFRNYYGSSGSTGGVIKVRGNQVSSPSVDNLVIEDDPISAEAISQTIDYIYLTLDYWSDGLGTNYSVNPTPDDHKTYTAYMKGKPVNDYRNLSFNTDEEGQPVRLTWSKHPLDNSSVTHYMVYPIVRTEKWHNLMSIV